MAKGYSSNRRFSGMNVIMTLIIIAVLVLGVIAVWGPIKENYKDNRISSGASNAGDIADQMGMSFDDFLAYYGLTGDEGINEDTDLASLVDNMTLENMSRFYWGVELTDDVFNAFKADQGIADDVTKDTKDADVKDKYNQYQQALQATEAPTEAAGDTAAADTAASADAAAAATEAAATEAAAE